MFTVWLKSISLKILWYKIAESLQFNNWLFKNTLWKKPFQNLCLTIITWKSKLLIKKNFFYRILLF